VDEVIIVSNAGMLVMSSLYQTHK